jgi:hypothetical protein
MAGDGAYQGEQQAHDQADGIDNHKASLNSLADSKGTFRPARKHETTQCCH